MSQGSAKTTVLIIDDELQMRRLIRACLERNNYDVLEAATGEEGIAAAIQSQPGIIILDLGLPDMDGADVLRHMREWTNIPIIILSVRDRDTDKVSTLDDGANDYLTKPFSTNELLARLRAAQRNSQPVAKNAVFSSGNLHVDLAARTAKINGESLKLSRIEYSLLRYFVQNAGRVLTHGQILREIWNLADASKTARLRVYVTYLREKIESNPARPELLITVPGVGYRLEVRE
jgi:two-component system KDP operon response regulator KdpE